MFKARLFVRTKLKSYFERIPEKNENSSLSLHCKHRFEFVLKTGYFQAKWFWHILIFSNFVLFHVKVPVNVQLVVFVGSEAATGGVL